MSIGGTVAAIQVSTREGDIFRPRRQAFVFRLVRVMATNDGRAARAAPARLV